MVHAVDEQPTQKSLPLVIPRPPPPRAGYIRAAAVQIDFHAAAVCQQIHLLEQPPMDPRDKSWPDWFGAEQTTELGRVRKWLKEIGRKMREIYVEHECKRLAEILTAVAKWDVQLVVFPEYSVPAECLEALLPLTKNMVVVFGTHAVEPRLIDDGFYGRFGANTPECGTSTAPVAVNGAVHYFQPKLNRTHLERDMTLGTHWASVEITDPIASRMGILICLDYLHRDGEPYRKHVEDKIDVCRIVAVPSLTPHYTTVEFNEKSVSEKERYGRAVLYANIADGGDTSIHVDSDMDRPNAAFPYGIPPLARGEEGIVVADIDCDYTNVSEKVSRRFAERPAAIPVAASILGYANVREDTTALADLAGVFEGCDMSDRASLTAAIRKHESKIAEIAERSPSTVQRRLNMLLDRYEQARAPEDMLCHLRDVMLSENVVPMAGLDRLRLTAASNLLASKLEPTMTEAVEVARLRKRLLEQGGER